MALSSIGVRDVGHVTTTGVATAEPKGRQHVLVSLVCVEGRKKRKRLDS